MDNKRILEIELEAHKSEFIALKDEMVQKQKGIRQYLNFSIIVFAAGFSITPTILENGFHFIFLFYFCFTSRTISS